METHATELSMVSPQEFVQSLMNTNTELFTKNGCPLPAYKLPENASVADTYNTLLKQTAALFDVDNDPHFYKKEGYPHMSLYDQWLNAFEKDQTTLLWLESKKLEEELGDNKTPTAKITRFKGRDEGSWVGWEPEPLFREGLPNVIAIANGESLTKQEQIILIIQTVIKPLSEIDEKAGGVKSLVFVGGAANGKESTGDIDLIIMMDGQLQKNLTDFSPNARSLYNYLVDLQEFELGQGKFGFHLSGESVTTDHLLDISIYNEDIFLGDLDASPERIAAVHAANIQKMKASGKIADAERFVPEVATIAQKMVTGGAYLVWGENTSDSKGKKVFIDRREEYR